MTSDINSREQRLRKQAELQSLYTTLASARKQEASYIDTDATIPEQVLHQINDLQQKIVNVESELTVLEGEAAELPAQKFYREGFEAQQNQDFDTAAKFYKNAARYGHPDGNVAVRSVRYLIKITKSKPIVTERWVAPAPSSGQSRNRLLIGLGVLVIVALAAIFVLWQRSPTESQEAVAIVATATDTSTSTSLPPTHTLTPSPVATHTPIPADTATLAPTNTLQPPTPKPPIATPTLADTATPTLTPLPVLRAAPEIIGPKDGLVWSDGAIVFEFVDLNSNHDELYCLNPLRGYDATNTENWSFPSVGRKTPFIDIEANPLHVAKAQGIRCIVWSAYVGKETCENRISENTLKRIIGLPHPCDFGSSGIP